MRNISLAHYAQKSFVAMKSPSVKEVNTNCIYELEQAIKQEEDGYYIGIKDAQVFPSSLINQLKQHGFFYHTKDVSSPKGRAIDPNLLNPITLRHMSGSSSGTAINVFLGINDCGIGTDGGGSVLAPALAVNLYGLISPLYCAQSLKQFQKQSTDNILFTPSLGFMSKSIDIIEKLHHVFEAETSIAEITPIFGRGFGNDNNELELESIPLSYDCLNRQAMINELLAFDFNQHLLITREGPIDLIEYGDSVMGHYADLTLLKQSKSGKYYLKVVNMAGLSALCVPNGELSSGYLVICKSDVKHINAALAFAKTLKVSTSNLEKQYFSIQNQL